jgi:hypothetical protein
MGLLDKLLGRDDPPRQAATPARSADEQAIERYRYMLRTAPPETIEQAHAEAFAQLTPEQRTLLLQEFSSELPEAERAAAAQRNDPQSLARLATRAEVRRPGTIERTFGGAGGRGMGMGGLMAGSFLSTMAGVVVGSAIAQSFLGDSGAGESAAGEAGADDAGGDMSADAGGDMGDMGDFGGGDLGDI